MTHRNLAARAGVAGLLGFALVVGSQLAPGVSAAGTAPAPHIVATPNNVMVNSSVKLVGRHFAPNAKIVLKECGQKNWIAPQNPCNKGKIRVKTNKNGRFTRSFDASLCPRSPWPGHPVTEERCYVGEVMPSGVDTIELVGHVKIIVTYP